MSGPLAPTAVGSDAHGSWYELNIETLRKKPEVDGSWWKQAEGFTESSKLKFPLNS